ncbi:MAG: alpha-glucuronidase family glycosyl hydrolase [Verrucomicrobiota bacterium]
MTSPFLRLPFWCSLAALTCAALSPARAEDGYRLWLRYENLNPPNLEDALAVPALRRSPQIILATPTGADSPTLNAAREELTIGLSAMFGPTPGYPASSPTIKIEKQTEIPAAAAEEGYTLKFSQPTTIVISARSDIGVLYGSFALLRQIQITKGRFSDIDIVSAPKIQRRLLDHWDNLDRFVERGYAGQSLWEWFYLPEIRSPRYRDYARALASVGLNGVVLNNVNANALILTPHYLRKVAALAEEFRPYGIRVYLTARFSAPIEIGGLKSADPFDPEVAAWWKKKTDEIYTFIPDFGGFMVKANSEGQPGPQDYKRTHADGANMMADALAPHGGVVMWRAFVYAADTKEDRVKQAYSEFMPLDGKFRDNVVIQIKNGPLDFMPREPFSPLFGAMRKTVAAPELQITQEYTGQSTQLVYLAPLWKEVLDADTHALGANGAKQPTDGVVNPAIPADPTSTVAHIADGTLFQHALSMIIGVANTGTDRNWTGHPLAQANWYAYGRLAWDHALTSEQIADEWIRLTYGSDPKVLATMKKILLGSRETMVNYSMPLGLHHIMAEGHHYGPGPWPIANTTRPDWSPPYYHQADATGLGANRTASGSNALQQYGPYLEFEWGNVDTVPENLLLWFHHVAWDHKMKSGRILWDELALRYQQGVDEVRVMQKEWDTLKGLIDEERFTEVRQRLARQELDARDWRDACLLYFQTFSKRPLPAGVEPPAHDLEYYKTPLIRFAPGHPGAK